MSKTRMNTFSWGRDRLRRSIDIVSNRIDFDKYQDGTLHMKVKNAAKNPMKFKTKIREGYFVFKSYGDPSCECRNCVCKYATFGGIWAYLTRRQALVLVRELLDYIGGHNA